ncbi:MFS transporter [Limnoglobus roseus]|uniref:MFS transporter n=1 Tax=Limnoglobus roseus TaxID=2598579 RepID=A0A5C1AFC2_9BACT|nr:MFS transporter [Limnoglobus roseus]QEL17500.1 MFS transporter [Limnoglobus roseus]
MVDEALDVSRSQPFVAAHAGSRSALSWRSWAGINAANFFLAEVTGVTLPFVASSLKDHGWSPFGIGVATALAGLGVFLMQTPAGIMTDRSRGHRRLLAVASLVLGVCYGLLPLVPPTPLLWDSLLFLSGAVQAFFLPVLGALALGLVGHAGLSRLMGANQSFNHAGNLAAALAALGLVAIGGADAVFYAVFAVSLLSAASVYLIRGNELNEAAAAGAKTDEKTVGLRELLRDRRVQLLFAATALFHLANAPVMPLVAQNVKELGGNDRQVAFVVLVAQAVMIPVALLAGWLVDLWGRKPVFAIGFIALPVRIALYALAQTPEQLIWIQTLDGIGAGIYGVVIVSMVADLTHGKGGFNALSGLIATALSIGGVIGPLMTGALTQTLGYSVAFGVFAGIAAVAAAMFLVFVPETRNDSQPQEKK